MGAGDGHCPHLYLGCSDVSEGDRSGTERDVEESVVAMEAVVASSKEGGVQGSRSGLPAGPKRRTGEMQEEKEEVKHLHHPSVRLFYLHTLTGTGHLKAQAGKCSWFMRATAYPKASSRESQ